MSAVRLMFLLLFLCLASCSEVKETSRTVQATVLDFSGYAARGFYFSPAPYLQPHEPKGLVRLTIISGTRISRGRDRKGGEMFGQFRSSGAEVLMVDSVGGDQVLHEVYVRARALGADALVQFSLEQRVTWDGEMQLPTYDVFGFAIKRLAPVPSDSAAPVLRPAVAASDSATAPPARAALPPDSAGVPADSATAPPDSAAVPAQSATAPRDSSSVPADSSAGRP